MSHDRNILGEFTQLPESLARALVADDDWHAFLEPGDESEDSIVNVSTIDDYQPAASDDHSKLFKIGDIFVSFELRGDSVSEVVAFHEDDLEEYVDTVFMDKPKRFVVTSEDGLDNLDSIV